MKINHFYFKLRMSLIVIVIFFLSGCKNPKQPTIPPKEIPKVDKEKTFALIEEIIAIGPRPSDSTNAANTAQFIFQKCEKFGFQPEVDSWTEKTVDGDKSFQNVYAELKGDGENFIILGSHFDTKILPGISNFVGANDSGSSTALVLEIMRVLNELPQWTGPSIRFAFFDGEEAVHNYTENDGLHGSKKLAKDLKKSGEYLKCKAMILLDMIGDKDLTVTLSPDDSRPLTQHLLAIAEKQNKRSHFSFFLHGVMIDDHVPFKMIGIPAIDIIDFKYGPNNSYWHSNRDTIDKLSPESLEIVGNIVLQMLCEL